MHRITGRSQSGARTRGSSYRGVVYLQHGLICSSFDFVANGPDDSLGFLLSDAGYDVWLGNFRGNTYSKNHTKLSVGKEAFWDFSWHEVGTKDVPAMVDYVLQVTGESKLTYIAHSMGTTAMFVALSTLPEYNDKINLFVAMAPVAALAHMRSAIKYIAKAQTITKWVMNAMGHGEFLASTKLIRWLGEKLCGSNSTNPMCYSILFLICGPDINQLNKDRLPVYIGHTPAGSSVREIIHYAQLHNKKNMFQQYDFGGFSNLWHYGSWYAPKYNLRNVKVKTAVYWGDNDYLAAPMDVQWLVSKLPNVVINYRVNSSDWSHLDFIWARRAGEMLYSRLTTLVDSITDGNF